MTDSNDDPGQNQKPDDTQDEAAPGAKIEGKKDGVKKPAGPSSNENGKPARSGKAAVAGEARKDNVHKKKGDKEETDNKAPPPEKKKWYLDQKILLAIAIGFMIFFLLLGSTFNTDTLMRENLKIALQRTLSVPVTIGGVEARPDEKKLFVAGIAIGSPPDYDPGVAMLIRSLEVDIGTVGEERVELSNILLHDIAVNLDVRSQGTNLTALHAGMERFASMDPADAAEESVPVAPIEVRVDQVEVSGGLIHILVDGQELEPIKLPPLRFTGPGMDDYPVMVSQAISEVMDVIVREIIQTAGKAGALDRVTPQRMREIRARLGLDMRSRAGEQLDRAGEKLQEWGQGIQDFIQERR